MDEKKIRSLGQITRFQEFGKRLYELAKDPEVKNILDIGTFFGMGSTKCIFDGVITKKNFNVISLETMEARVHEARKNLLSIPLKNFNIVHGSILTYDETASMEEEFPNHAWLQEDLHYVKTTPYVFDILPEKLDLVVIDGGMGGYLEFMKVWKRSRYLALHDTNLPKNVKTKKFIKENLDTFKIIYEGDLNGNGELICENLKFNE